MKRSLLAVVSLSILGACSSQQSSSEFSVSPVGFDALAGWSAEQTQEVMPVLRQECHRLAQLPPETSLGGAVSLPYGRLASDWSGACSALETATDARTFLQTWFQPYLVETSAFYTGYFEPQIDASLTQGGAYQTPLYRRPDDLVRAKATNGEMVTGRWVNGQFQPYYDRAAIDGGALAGRGLEIAWVKNPVDLFFLQIQGSGRLTLPDGRQIRVGYDGRNGQPYVPIGRVLVQENELASNAVSMDSIRNWLTAHPDRIRDILERNPNYVFFRTVSTSLAQGPSGAFGIPLTAGRSLAVDRSLIPFATPVWVETRLPDAKGVVGDWKHLAFAQDIGTDIKGAGRADLFTGWGTFAQYVAGNLHEKGQMTILLPRPPAVPDAQ